MLYLFWIHSSTNCATPGHHAPWNHMSSRFCAISLSIETAWSLDRSSWSTSGHPGAGAAGRFRREVAVGNNLLPRTTLDTQ
jgi:hypothetical protein